MLKWIWLGMVAFNAQSLAEWKEPTYLWYTPDYRCSELQERLERDEVVVMYQTPTIYDRYVVDGSFCALGEQAKAAKLKSADLASCYVGFTCKAK